MAAGPRSTPRTAAGRAASRPRCWRRPGTARAGAGGSARGRRRATLGPVAGLLPGVVARRLGRSSRPRFASSEKLREAVLRTAIALTDPAVVAVYDDPVAPAATPGGPPGR